MDNKFAKYYKKMCENPVLAQRKLTNARHIDTRREEKPLRKINARSAVIETSTETRLKSGE